MLRELAPTAIAALLVMAGAGVAYGLGAPAWVVYAALLVATAIIVPGVARWDERHPPSAH